MAAFFIGNKCLSIPIRLDASYVLSYYEITVLPFIGINAIVFSMQL